MQGRCLGSYWGTHVGGPATEKALRAEAHPVQAGSEEGCTMRIRPLKDRVVVRRVKEEEQTKGGLLIPDTAKEKPIEGTVVAAGAGRVLKDGSVRALDVKEGDRVIFGKYSGTEVKIEDVEHLILREDDILCVVEA
jgi:chaperonin GroES